MSGKPTARPWRATACAYVRGPDVVVLLRTVYERDLVKNWTPAEIAALAAEWKPE